MCGQPFQKSPLSLAGNFIQVGSVGVVDLAEMESIEMAPQNLVMGVDFSALISRSQGS